jgi:hypothetical protein
MSGTRVEYDGYLASGAATITPALRFDTRNLSLGAQGGWTVFESGNQIFQMTSAAAWLANLHKYWRFEISGAAGASRYAERPASSHLLTGGRLHLANARAGAWLGAVAGTVFDSDSARWAPTRELSLGAWRVREGLALVGSITRASLGDTVNVDVLGAARWTSEHLELEARAVARVWSSEAVRQPDTGVFAEISAFVPLGSHIALALAAGRYPSDPLRRVLSAKYASAGVRFTIAGSDEPSIPLVAGPTRVAYVDYGSTEPTTEPRLEIAPAGDTHTLRMHAPNATTVELMGDFTDWKPSAFTRAGDGLWEMRVALTPGIHRLNIRIDGGEWIVPNGARSEAGDFGAVGVIVIRY